MADLEADLNQESRYFKKRDVISVEQLLLQQLRSNAPSYAALVGFHLATKEIPDWTWSTFWWNPDPLNPSTTPYADKRPPNLPSPWSNYLMDTTLSMVTPYSQLAGARVPRICFNPYLEGQKPGGKTSNCMSCHRQAAYPFAWKFPKPGEYWGGDCKLFSDVIKTDYVWSLARGTTNRDPNRPAANQ